jgi:hypothetical protein
MWSITIGNPFAMSEYRVSKALNAGTAGALIFFVAAFLVSAITSDNGVLSGVNSEFLSEPFLGIESRYWYLGLALIAGLHFFGQLFLARSKIFVLNRLESSDLNISTKGEYREVCLKLGVSVYVCLAVPLLALTTPFTVWHVVFTILFFAALYAFVYAPYLKGNLAYVSSESDPTLDELEEINRLRLLENEWERKERIKSLRANVEEVQYQIEGDSRELAEKLSINSETNEAQPQSIESINALHDERIDALNRAEEVEVKDAMSISEDNARNRRLSTIKVQYNKSRSSVAQQRLNDLERLFASSSQQKLDKDSTFAQLNSEYEKSLKTLETFRIKELLRIDTIEQPSKREQAKIEFTETHAKMKRDLEAQHQRRVARIVGRP